MTRAPLVSFVTAPGVAARLGEALRAAGYRARSLPSPTLTSAPALEAWLVGHRPAALVLDARAVRLSEAPHVYDLTAARGVELVVGALYDRDEPVPDAPIGRRVGVADVVRAVQRALGPPEPRLARGPLPARIGGGGIRRCV